MKKSAASVLIKSSSQKRAICRLSCSLTNDYKCIQINPSFTIMPNEYFLKEESHYSCPSEFFKPFHTVSPGHSKHDRHDRHDSGLPRKSTSAARFSNRINPFCHRLSTSENANILHVLPEIFIGVTKVTNHFTKNL